MSDRIPTTLICPNCKRLKGHWMDCDWADWQKAAEEHGPWDRTTGLFADGCREWEWHVS